MLSISEPHRKIAKWYYCGTWPDPAIRGYYEEIRLRAGDSYFVSCRMTAFVWGFGVCPRVRKGPNRVWWGFYKVV